MKVAPQFRRYIESDYNNLKVDPESVDLDIHEPDSSHSTRMELEELESIVAEAKLPPKIMRVADKSPLSLFYSVAKKKGLDPLEEEAKEWAEDWTKLSFEFKLKFKRRRPYEVKREHDIDFIVDKSDTSESPSYPSGHAMMGYGVAEFYKEKYPFMSEEWDNVAEIIAHSRLQMGVHYPSDVEASKRVVEQLAGDDVKMASYLDLEDLFDESGPLTKLASYANFLSRLTPEARAAFRQFRGRGKSQTSWVSDFNRWAQETGQDASRLFSNQRDSRRYATMNSSAYQDYVNYTAKNKGATFLDWRQAGGSRGGNPITPAQMLRNKPAGGYTPPQLQSRKPVTISSGNKAPGQGASSLSQPVPKVNNTPAPTNTPTPGATPPEVAKPIGFFRGAGQAVKNNPGKTAIGLGGAGIVGYKVSEDRSKEAGLPSINSILKATESGLAKLKLPELADKVDLYRARRNLSRAVKDLHKYESATGRFGQMPRIVIPKSHLDIPDLYRLGFQDSLIAVPEIGQKTWTTYRHPLDKLHLHDHGKYLNMHIDSLPSLQMIAERNSLTDKARRKLMETIPEGVKAWRPGKSKDVGFLKKFDDQVSGLGHAILEGGPGYLNYAIKQLNPWKVSMAEEILSKLPKDYLKKRYGITKVSSEQSKLAAPMIIPQLLKKVISGTNRSGFLASGDTTSPLEADPNYIGIVPPKPKRKRQELEEIVRLVRDEIAKASPEDMEYSKLVASGLPMEEIVAQELVDPFTSRDNWTLTPEEYKQFRNSVIKDKKKLYPVARPYALAERYGIDLGLPEDVAQRNARMHPAFANFSYPSFHTARGAFLAETARDLVPEDQQHLVDDLIARIGRSRIQQGVHSHQDVEAGEAMGREAAKIYKELGIKTSAYKDYRPRGTLYLLDGKGGVMADKPTADYNSTTPYFFPGGGIFEEEKVDRLPTRDEIVGGVEREALEELGTKLKNVRVLQDEPANVDMPDWWRERQKKKRGVDYKGIAEFFAAAERGGLDKSIYGADNDEFKGTFYPIDEVASALEANAKPGDDYYEDSMRQARLLRSLLEKTSSDQPPSLQKQANDLSVLTAVPTQNLDLIMRKGLYSQKAMLEDPEVMAAFLAQRNADKAWKNDEQYDEKRFREQYDKRRKLIEDKGGSLESLEGPSVFFTEPDPDKVSDPRHFINKFNTETLRVNLAKLLKDIPDTRIHGAELAPWDDEAHAADPDNYYKQVHRDITPEEVSELIARGSKDLWKDYGEEHIGRYYAANVPHAFIRTPSGIIPPEYLEPVEKTSSAKEQLKHILKKKAALEDEFQPDLSPEQLKELGVYDQVYGDAPSEASMKEWPEHWINKQDPLGWLQWYDRYSGGRRTDDDERQMKRWKSFKARHLAQYLKKPTPRRAAALRNWGIDVEKY